MGKIRQWVRRVIDKWIEISFQKQANKMFHKDINKDD